MGIRRMQGTSAHLECIVPKDGKRKSDCLYYKKAICCCNKLPTYLNKCVGRVYCEHFKTKEEVTSFENIKDDNLNFFIEVTDDNKDLINKNLKLKDIENNNIVIITFVEMKDLNGKLTGSKFLNILRNKSVGDRIKFKKRKYVIIGMH